ncbi:hypothetical protein J437_LFUL003895 [Ladona fulva]|uniref:Myb/SANT-like DNA-binding domain-containing protein n=1 Tax=Ladona fulva TaxID=123851 RepID=A0A8K0K4W8_LADFU|nr:hypothetical protein J437_LFUL003895 [Ladona fulva]
MSEAEEAIIKPGEAPYVTVFVSESEVNGDNEDSHADTQQIIVHTGENVAVEEYNDIHCVISHEHVNLESTENDDFSNDSNRTLWTRNNVKLLISEYKAMKQDFQDPGRKQKDLWATLAHRLSERIAKDSTNSWMASQVTWDACDRKWRNLKHTFKSIHTNQWRSYRSRSRWEFYHPLLEIFGDSIRGQLPKKREGAKYVVVHPQDDNKSASLPAAKKSVGNMHHLSSFLSSEEGGSGEETMFVEELKVDECTGGSYVVVKPSKESSMEPRPKHLKVPREPDNMHGQVKVEQIEYVDILNVNRGHSDHSMDDNCKLRDDSHEEIDGSNTCGLDCKETLGNSKCPPAWFMNFLREYHKEEQDRREALQKAHEDILRVEERKVKALESILNKLCSPPNSKSLQTSS